MVLKKNVYKNWKSLWNSKDHRKFNFLCLYSQILVLHFTKCTVCYLNAAYRILSKGSGFLQLEPEIQNSQYPANLKNLVLIWASKWKNYKCSTWYLKQIYSPLKESLLKCHSEYREEKWKEKKKQQRNKKKKVALANKY